MASLHHTSYFTAAKETTATLAVQLAHINSGWNGMQSWRSSITRTTHEQPSLSPLPRFVPVKNLTMHKYLHTLTTSLSHLAGDTLMTWRICNSADACKIACAITHTCHKITYIMDSTSVTPSGGSSYFTAKHHRNLQNCVTHCPLVLEIVYIDTNKQHSLMLSNRRWRGRKSPCMHPLSTHSKRFVSMSLKTWHIIYKWKETAKDTHTSTVIKHMYTKTC